MYELLPLRRVELDVLLLVELVVLRVAKVRVVVVEVVLALRDTRALEVGEHGIRVDVRRPAPLEEVVVGLRDLGVEPVLVHGLLRDRDADFIEPAAHEVGHLPCALRLGVDEVREVERIATAGHLADAVAVRVLVASLVEEAVRLVEIEGDLLALRDIGDPVRAGAGADRRGGPAEAHEHSVDEGLLVDRVSDRQPDVGIEERGVRLLQAVAAVDRELVEPALLADDDHDALRGAEALDRVVRNVVRDVDLAALQCGHHRVGVVEDPEDDLVDLWRPAPVARVRLHRPELPALRLLEDERAGADVVDPVVLLDLVLVVLLPDVLREDVDVHRRELRVVDLARDLDGARVERLRRDVLDGRGVVVPLLVARSVDRVHDVLRGQRRAVRPLETLAKLVGVGLAVLGSLPRLGEAGDGPEVVRCLVGQGRVLEVPHVVVRDLDADHRVEAVVRLGDPDGEDDLLVVLRQGCACGQEHDHDRNEDRQHGLRGSHGITPLVLPGFEGSWPRPDRAVKTLNALTTGASRGSARRVGRSRSGVRLGGGRALQWGRSRTRTSCRGGEALRRAPRTASGARARPSRHAR